MWEVVDIAAADTAVVVVAVVAAADDDDVVVDKDRNVHKMMSEEVEGLSLPYRYFDEVNTQLNLQSRCEMMMMPVSFRIPAKEMGVLSHHYHSLDVMLLVAAVEVASMVVVSSCDIRHHQFVAVVVADDVVEGHVEVEVEEISYHMLHLETLVGVHLRPPEKQHHRYDLVDDEENASVAALDLDLDLTGRCILLRLLLLVLLYAHREATSLIVIVKRFASTPTQLFKDRRKRCCRREVSARQQLVRPKKAFSNTVTAKAFWRAWGLCSLTKTKDYSSCRLSHHSAAIIRLL